MPPKPKAPARRPNRDGSQSGDLQNSGGAAGGSFTDNADLEDANSRLKAENDELSHKLTEAEREARLQKSAANKARAQTQVQQIEKKQMEREARDAKKQAELANQEVDNVVFEVVVGMSLDADPAQKPDGIVQQGLKKFIDSTLFNGIVYAAILLNCVTLAANNPNPDPQYRPGPGWDDFYVVCEQAFTIIFNAEMGLKLAALHMEYFSDNWNNFDFIVTVMGDLSMLNVLPNVSALRALRMLKIIRLLKKSKGPFAIFSALFDVLLDSALGLRTIFFFMVFTVSVYSILGMELFSGALTHRCFSDTTGDVLETDGAEVYAYIGSNSPRCGGEYSCPAGYQCYLPGSLDDTGGRKNPGYGAASFDTYGNAMLVLTFCTALEGFSMPWFQAARAVDSGLASAYFAFAIIFFGTFTMNFFVAMMAVKYRDGTIQFDRSAKLEAAAEALVLEHEEKVAATAALALMDKDAQNELDEKYHGEEKPDDGPSYLKLPCLRPIKCIHDHWLFEASLILAIIMNGILLAVKYTPTTCLIPKGCPACDCIIQAGHMEQSALDTMSVFNTAFLVIFTAELVIKLIVLTPSGYFADGFNTFDAIIVLLAYVEMAGDGGGAMSVLRMLRVLRILKMTKSMASFQSLIASVSDTLPSWGFLTFIMFLLWFIFSVVGMHLFAGKVTQDMNYQSYNTLGNALSTTFMLIIGDGWVWLMYETMYQVGDMASVYNILVMVILRYVMKNLLMATLMSNLECGDPKGFGELAIMYMVQAYRMIVPLPDEDPEAEAKKKAEEEAKKREARASAELAAIEEEKRFLARTRLGFNKLDADASGLLDRAEIFEALESMGVVGTDLTEQVDDIIESVGNAEKEVSFEGFVELLKNPIFANAREKLTAALNSTEQLQTQIEADKDARRKKRSGAGNYQPRGKSLGLMGPNNIIRVAGAMLTNHWLFDSLIMVCILASSACLCFDGPTLVKGSNMDNNLKLLDEIFLFIFTGELVIKILVYGLVWEDRKAYLNDLWNVLDCVIVAIGWIGFILAKVTDGASGAASKLRVLRTLRVLRPLRTIKRLPALRLVVNVMYKCIPALQNIFVLNMFILFMFSVMAGTLLQGKLWYCTDWSVSGVDECFGQDSGGNDRQWLLYPEHFEDTFNSMLTMFEISYMENWVDVLWMVHNINTGDGTGPEQLGLQPTLNTGCKGKDQIVGHNTELCLGQFAGGYTAFFILWIFVGNMLCLNLFTGAVFEKFKVVKSEYVPPSDPDDESAEASGGGGIMTESQQNFVESMRLLTRSQPIQWLKPPPGKKGGWRHAMYSLIMNTSDGKNDGSRFEMAVGSLILLNVLVMGMYTFTTPKHRILITDVIAIEESQNTPFRQVLELLNTIFTFIFLGELIIKISGLGFKQYIRDSWNKLDFTIVFLSLAHLVIVMFDIQTPLNPSVFRILRITRLLRSARMLKNINLDASTQQLVESLMTAIIYTLPSILNILGLMALLLFIFAIVGMNLFGEITTEWEDTPHFYGEFWAGYGRDLNFKTFGKSFLSLVVIFTGEGYVALMRDIMAQGHWLTAPIYFILYLIIINYLMCNLMLSIAVDQFESSFRNDLIRPSCIDDFLNAWAKADPNATHFIRPGQLKMVLAESSPPIQVRAEDFAKEMTTLGISVTADNKIHLVDTYVNLVQRVYRIARQAKKDDDGEDDGEPTFGAAAEGIASKFGNTLTVVNPGCGFAEIAAAQKLQAVIRGWKHRRNSAQAQYLKNEKASGEKRPGSGKSSKPGSKVGSRTRRKGPPSNDETNSRGGTPI